MAEIYVDEFLYRGQPSENIASAAWHVVLGAADVDAFGQTTLNTIGPLNMAQAEAKGYPLPALLGMINDASLKQIESVQAQLAAAQQELTDAQTQIAALQQQLADAQAQIPAPPPAP